MNPASYWLPQGARVGVYLAQYLLSARLSRPIIRRRGRPRGPRRASPTLNELLGDLRRLLLRDWRNIRDGLYWPPPGLLDDPRALAINTLRYFDDLPEVNDRRRRDAFEEVRDREAGIEGRRLPDYYLRNFHFQTDGYLSEHSARLYDHQVEVLFLGGAEAMRRQALVPLGAWLRRRRVRAPRMADLGCGTGRFLGAVRHNFPALATIGVDLSRAYLAEARRYLAPWPGAMLIEGQAEALPVADASLDLITAVYLLHEVPADVRAGIADECARTLRPGGRLILIDSLQFGDRSAYDVLLETFPDGFHEPYYTDYAQSDLTRLMADRGLSRVSSELAFLSKVMVFDKR
ncbi:MAG: class I SAM-dependent methyltransferase [Rhodospirillales bacterium]